MWDFCFIQDRLPYIYIVLHQRYTFFVQNTFRIIIFASDTNFVEETGIHEWNRPTESGILYIYKDVCNCINASHLPDEFAAVLIIISRRSKSLLSFCSRYRRFSRARSISPRESFNKTPSKKLSDALNYSRETRPPAKNLPLLYTARCNTGPFVVTLVTWFYHVVKRPRRSYRHQRRLIVYLLPTMESHRLCRARRPLETVLRQSNADRALDS